MDKLKITRELVADLTVAELELLEEKTARPLSQLFTADAPRGILLHTLAYITLRRDDPATTWETAGDVRVDLELEDDEPEVVSSTADPTVVGRGKRRG